MGNDKSISDFFIRLDMQTWTMGTWPCRLSYLSGQTPSYKMGTTAWAFSSCISQWHLSLIRRPKRKALMRLYRRAQGKRSARHLFSCSTMQYNGLFIFLDSSPAIKSSYITTWNQWIFQVSSICLSVWHDFPTYFTICPHKQSVLSSISERINSQVLLHTN